MYAGFQYIKGFCCLCMFTAQITICNNGNSNNNNYNNFSVFQSVHFPTTFAALWCSLVPYQVELDPAVIHPQHHKQNSNDNPNTNISDVTTHRILYRTCSTCIIKQKGKSVNEMYKLWLWMDTNTYIYIHSHWHKNLPYLSLKNTQWVSPNGQLSRHYHCYIM